MASIAIIPRPALPAPPSWYPGHMSRFAKMLPALLARTDVVLELRDARLPLTSINRTLEGALRQWRAERGRGPGPGPALPPRASTRGQPTAPRSMAAGAGNVCERVVVFSKRDLVPEWGMEPFRRAMAAKFPDQRLFFASWHRPRDIRNLSEMLVNLAKEHPHASELNVLVIGMPNVGKSTLLNALRNIGIAGPTAKALRTSSQPGLTRTISTRLKLSEDPLVYAYDSPGVMVPFLGKGEKGAERGIKLALIAGIKESLYDTESLAAYLLYRLYVLNPAAPVYMSLLPPSSPPITDVVTFLDLLAQRLGMLKRGGERDVARAAVWFVRWWREEGGLLAAAAAPSALTPSPLVADTTAPPPAGPRRGWGFDMEWDVDGASAEPPAVVQAHMEACIDNFVDGVEEDERDGGMSTTQERKRLKEEKLAKRAVRVKAMLAAKGITPTRSRSSAGR